MLIDIYDKVTSENNQVIVVTFVPGKWPQGPQKWKTLGAGFDAIYKLIQGAAEWIQIRLHRRQHLIEGVGRR